MPFEVQQQWILYRSHRPEHTPQTAAVLLCISGLVFRSFNFLCSIYAREDALLFRATAKQGIGDGKCSSSGCKGRSGGGTGEQ